MKLPRFTLRQLFKYTTVVALAVWLMTAWRFELVLQPHGTDWAGYVNYRFEVTHGRQWHLILVQYRNRPQYWNRPQQDESHKGEWFVCIFDFYLIPFIPWERLPGE